MTTTHRDRGDRDLNQRQSWLTLADGLVAAAQKHASPAGALVRLPGLQSGSGAWSDGLEGYARTFLAAALRARGSEGADPLGHLDRYTTGLAAGVDPSHAERWPTFLERRQAVPEAASIAICLSETRTWLWDELDSRVRQHVVDWMSGIIGMTGFRSNWLWFQNVIEAFLSSVGVDVGVDDFDRNTEFAETLYVGDGWYSDSFGRDGERQAFDWYAGWAWHVYPVLHARIRGTTLDDEHRRRLRRYLEQAQHLVGSDGAPVLIGRSAAYRFATTAPFWAGVLADATPLVPGGTRALAARSVTHFLDNGALTEDGLLSIGWHGEFTPIRQLYTGSSSSYWASKALLGLLLPADHAEWTTTAPEAAGTGARISSMQAPGWLVVETPADGIVRVLNHGSDRMLEPRIVVRADDPFYRRIGYSNTTSPQLGANAVAAPRESNATLLDIDGAPAHRDGIERLHLGERVAVSRSRVHWLDAPGDGRKLVDSGWAGLRRGPWLTVASIVNGVTELRLAWWTATVPTGGRATRVADADAEAAWPADDGPWRVSFGGWPLAAENVSSTVQPSEARVNTGRRVSTVRAVRPAAEARVIRREDADPFARVSLTPLVETGSPIAERQLAAAIVSLSGTAIDPEQPEITIESDLITVVWKDGTADAVPLSEPVQW